jgi:malonyl-CoA O-methyltransferase
MNELHRRVADAFSRAARQYETAATVQKEIATRLAARILAGPLASRPRVLEIGAGTGWLSRLLLEKIAGGEWLLTDISAAMLDQCRGQIHDPRVRFTTADGEEPPEGPFDLIVSSLTLQWLSNPRVALERLAARLSPGGTLAFATLGAQTFVEWRAAHETLGVPCGVRSFPTASEMEAWWPPGGRGHITEEHLLTHHDHGRAFARHLKALGARTPCPGYRPLPLSDFRRLLAQFETGCPVTYHVLYGRFVAASS